MSEVRTQGGQGVLLASYYHGELAKRCDAQAPILRAVIANDMPLSAYAGRHYGSKRDRKGDVVYIRPTDRAKRLAEDELRAAADMVVALVARV